MKSNIAKTIRIITVPPILVALMLVVLWLNCGYIFQGKLDFIIALLGLGLFPILAYPLQRFIPKFKDTGRSGQRTLAFICSVIGYLLAFIYGEISGGTKELKIIFSTYLLSVLLLVILNKLCKVRASGHACSITGPLVFLSYFIGWKMAIVCVLIAAASFWASLALKRHKWSDLVTGAIVCIVSFVFSLLFI